MTSPRVVHLLDGRHFGGAEQMVRLLARNAPQVGVDARVYLLNEGRLAEFLRHDGTPVRIFPSRGKLDPRPLRTMAQALREDRAQIIQAHTSRTHLMARLLASRVGIRNITTIQSPIAQDENQGIARHPLRAKIERLGRRWTDHICPVSREEAERLIRKEGADPEHVTWIPNGIEDCELASGPYRSVTVQAYMDKKGIEADALITGLVAQLRPRKGPETLIDAFGRFRREGGKGFVLVFGDDEFAGPGYLDSLKARARDQGLTSHIDFLGFQSDPWTLAGGCDLIVLPSLFGEGLPLSLLEAMNHARAVAASDVPGNRECVIDGETGWLHPPGDEQTLARHLGQAVSDRHATAQLGVAGRKVFLAHFEIQTVLRRWREVYDRLCTDGASSSA